MKHLFVPYEIALQLKEKGFNEPCFGGYYTDDKEAFPLKWFDNNNHRIGNGKITAPLYQQVIDWLFKKLDFSYPYLKIEIFSDGSGMWYQFADDGNDKLEINFDNLNQAIEEALKLI